MKERKGSVYARGGVLWIAYYDHEGKRRLQTTGLPVGQEKAAQRALDAIRARVEAGTEIGATDGPPTVRQWGKEWLERREKKGVAMAHDESRRLDLYIYPALGTMRLEDMRTRHVRRFVDDLAARKSAMGGTLSPRTVRHIYGTLRQLMADAKREDLIVSSPCDLARGDLPAMRDKDPEWRVGAVFTRDELEVLISDDDGNDLRRVSYALLGLAGLRWGEAAALRWRAYDAKAEPLGRLSVAVAASDRRGGIGRTKTGATRQVPVHPTLAKVLAAWKLGGWARLMGREAKGEDLILPAAKRETRRGAHALQWLYEDCDRLGYRRRRIHDFRRTFISLAQDDGASPEVLRWITHTPASADIVASYTSLRWGTLCEAVARLRVGLRDPAATVLLHRKGSQ